MFQGLISLLTVAAMLAHSFLGCCAQHTRPECCSETRPAAACAKTTRSTCRHAHAHRPAAPAQAAKSKQGPAEHPHHHGPCDKGRCHFVATLKVDAPTVDSALLLDEGLTSVALQEPRALHSMQGRAALSSTGLPPDRHVRNVTQVWLL